MKTHRTIWLIAAIATCLATCGAAARQTTRDYRFDGTISRTVLENYLSRAITMGAMLHGIGDDDDNIRMLTNIGAKFAGRAIYRWGGEASLESLLAEAEPVAVQVHQADPDIVLQAAAFEIVTEQVNQIPIPAHVFEQLGLEPEQRNFRYEAMLYPDGHRVNHWSRGASVPDMSRRETQRWFVYLCERYIDIGIEAIHFGQVEIMDDRDPDHVHWRRMMQLVRQYARQHARRHMVLCDAHVPSGGIVHDGKLMFDFHSFPLRIDEVVEKPQHGVLKMGYLDSLFGRSKGGVTPSGWTCESLPYLVELDNFGRSGREGQNIGAHWIWGYDEICWFAHQSEAYRNEWLRYAWDWIRAHDSNGYLQMPGSRTLAAPVGNVHWYWANTKSDAVPTGFNQEETIKEIWSRDVSPFPCFDTKDVNEPTSDAPVIAPWRIVNLDPEYGGQWIVAGDLDNDGAPEIVSCENVNKNDVHYTSTAVAHRLDGSVLWHWGDPQIGRKTWHHDVACQIHDWNGDGTNEVVLCTKGFLVELDGANGKERKRIAIPDDATDCLVFCNLSGADHAGEVLVKNRYHQIWAYSRDGVLLWTVKDPGGFRTAHQPLPIDVDGDGRDEIFAGYALLNADGSVRWVFKSKAVDQARGHLDCARVLRHGKTPEAFRIALTCCGANNVALIDGNGAILWEIPGRHFESIDIGRVFPDHAGPQILMDVDHQPRGKSPVWVLDEHGRPLGQITTTYSRHHALLDWDGDGLDEIIVAHGRGMYDRRGQRIATLGTPGIDATPEPIGYEKSLPIGDMTGDGVADILIATPYKVYVYQNTAGEKPHPPAPLGTGPNFTLY